MSIKTIINKHRTIRLFRVFLDLISLIFFKLPVSTRISFSRLFADNKNCIKHVGFTWYSNIHHHIFNLNESIVDSAFDQYENRMLNEKRDWDTVICAFKYANME